ncbi:MAG: DUF349 domain-containing protein [Acidobacteria bacterium]|nr:DUF349 domain-containing protein [Acidobacteriota bacterium]MXZ70821.1 DUF349 domain-containing protein [Acidobacteriota bacterium]MYJ04534.1 DUF349 domain-containing protein [Acidobacteriota bacterium]
MKLLERLRSQPAWQSADPSGRIEAVRGLDDDAVDLLIEIAREDPAPEVRLAAVEQMPNLRTLVRFLQDPGDDAAARAEAVEGVRETLVEAADDIDMTDAFDVLTDEQDRARIARAAKSEVVARAALERVNDEATLGAIARGVERTDLAVDAVARIASRDELLAVAVKAEFKGPALAACERLSAETIDEATLDVIVRTAHSKASARWARAQLAARAEPEEPETPAEPEPDPDVGVSECERLEALADSTTDLEQGRSDLDAILETWSSLDGPVAPEVGARFAEARTAAEDRLLALDQTAVEAQRAAEQQAAAAAAEAEAEAEAIEARRQAAAAEAEKREREAEQARLEAAEAKAARKKAARDNLTQLETLLDRVATVMAGDKGVSLGEAERLLREARQALKEMPPLPSRHDRESITRKLKARVTKLTVTVRELREFADWQQWANLGVQETLCREMEALASDDGSAKDDAALAGTFSDIMKRWRQAADVPKARGQELWERFKAAHDKVYPRCESYFAARKEEQAKNLKRRRELVEEAERLAESTDWLKTVERMAVLQKEWKALGSAPYKAQRKLWDRFREANGTFFERRKANLTERKQVWADNYASKVALCERIEALADADDLAAAINDAKQAQAEWKSVGPVKRSRSDAIWKRFRAACDALFDRHKERQRESGKDRARPADGERSTPPAADREQQLARLSELCERAEKLLPEDQLPPADASRESPAEMLARQWRERMASNTMGRRDDSAARQRAARDEVKRLVAARRQLGSIRGKDASALDRRFQRACNQVFQA